MEGSPVTKRARVWNPALDDIVKSEDSKQADGRESPLDLHLNQGVGPTNALEFARLQHSLAAAAAAAVQPQAALPVSNAIPFIMQNYLQFAMACRIQQQQQQHHHVKKQVAAAPSMSRNDSIPTLPMSHTMPTIFSPFAAPPVISTSPNTPTGSQTGVTNPIVQSVLGASSVNENCCAVCGAAFRLTGDLVTHMRNNHRQSRYRRRQPGVKAGEDL